MNLSYCATFFSFFPLLPVLKEFPVSAPDVLGCRFGNVFLIRCVSFRYLVDIVNVTTARYNELGLNDRTGMNKMLTQFAIGQQLICGNADILDGFQGGVDRYRQNSVSTVCILLAKKNLSVQNPTHKWHDMHPSCLSNMQTLRSRFMESRRERKRRK